MLYKINEEGEGGGRYFLVEMVPGGCTTYISRMGRCHSKRYRWSVASMIECQKRRVYYGEAVI